MIKSPTTKRFIAEVKRRCKPLAIAPHVLIAWAGIRPEMWDRWQAGTTPQCRTMDRVIAKLDELEGANRSDEANMQITIRPRRGGPDR